MDATKVTMSEITEFVQIGKEKIVSAQVSKLRSNSKRRITP